MPYILDDINTAARVDVHDVQKAKYDDTPDMLKIINDGIDILHSILCNFVPNLYRVSVPIALTVVGKNGPYIIDAGNDLKRFEWVEDQYGNRLTKTYRGESLSPLNSGQPQKYWLEGFNPTKIYFDKNPDVAYAYTAYYIKNIVRAANLQAAYPHPDNTFMSIVAYVVYALMNINEYNTMDEQQRIALMTTHLSDDILTLTEDIQLNVYAGFPDGPSDDVFPMVGNPLNL